jgi:penicillin-binding protein 1A
MSEPDHPSPRRRESPIFVAVRFIFTLGVTAAGLAAIVGGLVAWNYYQSVAADLPTIDGLRTYEPPVMSRVYASDDQLIGELANERRIFVPIAAIPRLVRNAFIAAEDQNFYTHHGIDPFAILRAAGTDLARMGDKRRPVGASTITQQVARNMLLGSDTLSLRRKAQEALLALRLEHVFSKDRILELYLNEIYLGEGAYGVAAAGQAYFNKRLEDLTPAECAMLASLPKSPTNYNPFHAPDAALARRNWVIGRMVDTGAITADQGGAALAAALNPAEASRPALVEGSDWFAEEVRRDLIARFGPDRAAEGGFSVRTSLDPALQQEADRALRAGLAAYDHSHGGWRGASKSLPAEKRGDDKWAASLAEIGALPGSLPGWQLAVVRGFAGNSAILGVLPRDDAPDNTPPVQALATVGAMGWTRLAGGNGVPTGPITRITDALHVGDVIMVELTGSDTQHTGHGHSAVTTSYAHAELRQVPKVAGALVSLEPRTGRVVAMSGGWSFDASKFNRVTQAQRQPGSSFKPFVYLTAMEQGISPSARFDDEPITIGTWSPNNYEMTFGGPTPLRIALEESLNLVTVRLAEHIGMDAVAKTAMDFHLVDAMPRVLPAALGAVETTVMREAGAYASLATGGRQVTPTLIDSVQDRDGRIVWRPPGLAFGAADPSQPPVFTDPRPNLADPQSAYQIIMMMQGVAKYGTGAVVTGNWDRDVAAKTGTSQDYNDAWFAAMTPDLVTIVWVGFDTPQTLGDRMTGAVTAGPIWRGFMEAALKDRPKLAFRAPDGIELFSWDCGKHACIDAFKPAQVPGEGYGVAALGATASTKDETPGTPGNVQMVPADPNAPPKPAPGTGVDSGVGGIY